MLAFSLTPDLIAKFRQFDNELLVSYTQIKQLSELELAAMHQYARISTIGASTRIENALLTDPEVYWLDTILTADGKQTAFEQHKAIIQNKLSKDRERSIEKVAGCRNMLMLIFCQGVAPFMP